MKKSIVIFWVLFLACCSTVKKSKNDISNNSRKSVRIQSDSKMLSVSDSLGLQQKNRSSDSRETQNYERFVEEEISVIASNAGDSLISIYNLRPMPTEKSPAIVALIQIKRKSTERGSNAHNKYEETEWQDSSSRSTTIQRVTRKQLERDSSGAYRQIVKAKTRSGVRWIVWVIGITITIGGCILWMQRKRRPKWFPF